METSRALRPPSTHGVSVAPLYLEILIDELAMGRKLDSDACCTFSLGREASSLIATLA